VNPFSFNQATAKYWPLVDVVKGCAALGVEHVGLWREPVAEYGLSRSVSLVRDAGLSVTSLCRGGFFGAEDWLDDNRRALDERRWAHRRWCWCAAGCSTVLWPTHVPGWRPAWKRWRLMHWTSA
jgi:sugar phosphate isomerase/epimerase